MIGQPGAVWVPSPFYSKMKWPYDGGRPKWIIIHGTASGVQYPASATAHDFQKQGNSVHYVVGYDGSLYQCVSEESPSWGNGVISGPAGTAPVGGGNPQAAHDAFWDSAGHHDPNGCTISIEHSKSVDNKSSLSTAQQNTSFALIDGICSRWGIPRQYANANGGITGHFSMDPVNRSFCPGTYPWQTLFMYLSGNKSGNTFYSFGSGDNLTMYGGITTSTYKDIQPPTPIMQQVHDTLISHPGFYGIALAVDEAEQFPGWIDLTQPVTTDVPVVGTVSIPDFIGMARSIGATLSDNFLPFAIRSGLVLIGILLILALTLKPVLGLIGK